MGKMAFGDRLAFLRSQSDLSQDELAKSLKVGKSTLGMYETNKREPDHEMTARIATFFGVSIDWLVSGKELLIGGQLVEIRHAEIVLKDIVEKYNIDVITPKNKEKLEKIIELVFGD